MPAIKNYRGIIPAISCPFTPDHRIDEAALRKLASWLATHDGVVAIMTNGHTGEVFSLTPSERAEVTRIVADHQAKLGLNTDLFTGQKAGQGRRLGLLRSVAANQHRTSF